MRQWGPRKADDGEVRHDGDGKQSGAREGREKGEKRPVRFLTPRRSSGSYSCQQKSIKAAAATAIEMRWRRRRCRLGLRGKDAAAAECAEPRARGGGFIVRPRGLGVRARGVTRRGRPGLVPRLDSGSNPSLARGGRRAQ
jgi:hypothetical protein